MFQSYLMFTKNENVDECISAGNFKDIHASYYVHQGRNKTWIKQVIMEHLSSCRQDLQLLKQVIQVNFFIPA